MRKKHQSSRRIRRLFGPMFFACAVVYLAFHALNGERGIYALLKEQRKLEVLKTEVAKVSHEREDLEHRSHLLSDDSLDLDMLDERARSVLGMAEKNEVLLPATENPVVITSPKQ